MVFSCSPSCAPSLLSYLAISYMRMSSVAERASLVRFHRFGWWWAVARALTYCKCITMAPRFTIRVVIQYANQVLGQITYAPCNDKSRGRQTSMLHGRACLGPAAAQSNVYGNLETRSTGSSHLFEPLGCGDPAFMHDSIMSAVVILFHPPYQIESLTFARHNHR